MIGVFVASCEKYAEIEPVTEYSIKANASEAVAVHIVRPEYYGMQPTGCTSFTNVRYAVPEIARGMGYRFAIYLDVDMLVLGDVAELYAYAEAGKWVCLTDGSNEVSVIDTSIQYPPKEVLHKYHKSQLRRNPVAKIPMCWNVEDRVEPGMNILHFTDLRVQPWFDEHPDAGAVEIWEDYRKRLQLCAG